MGVVPLAVTVVTTVHAHISVSFSGLHLVGCRLSWDSPFLAISFLLHGFLLSVIRQSVVHW